MFWKEQRGLNLGLPVNDHPSEVKYNNLPHRSRHWGAVRTSVYNQDEKRNMEREGRAMATAEGSHGPTIAVRSSGLSMTQFRAPATLPVFRWEINLQALEIRLAWQAIQELRLSHPDSPVSNVRSTYMSPWKSHLINPKLGPLCDLVVQLAGEASVLYWKAKPEDLRLKVWDCWAAIYEQADFTQNHSHYPADLSCVVYLEAQQGCAPIVFDNQTRFDPTPGTIVIFPGNLNHMVPKTEGKRTVIALNLHKGV